MYWTTVGVYFSNSFLRGWSIQEGGHFARVRYLNQHLLPFGALERSELFACSRAQFFKILWLSLAFRKQ